MRPQRILAAVPLLLATRTVQADLGFRLDQVRDLLRLSSEKTKACAEVDRIAEQHRRTVEEKLADLTRLASELRRLSACCRGKGLIADCRIIEALSPW